MNDSDPGARLEKTVRHLRAQNRRYRELIQNLSSALGTVTRNAQHEREQAPVLEAFESFTDHSRPTMAPQRPAAHSSTDDGPGMKTPTGLLADNLEPLQPNPGWKCLAIERPQIRIGFTMFGMSAAEIEEAVRIVEQRQVRSRDFIPVFVIDAPVFVPFRSRGYVVEYVSKSAAGGRDADAGRRHMARLELIVAKWGLRELVDLGNRLGPDNT